MPDPTYIPGYLGTVTINSDDLSAVAGVVRLNLSRNVMVKPAFGAASAYALGGQKSGTFSAQGHISTEKIADIQALYATGRVTFSLQIGDGAGATDAGVYSGTCELSALNIEASADGEWDWSIDATTAGTVTYTPGS